MTSVAVLIPSTTKNRNWKCMRDTYLYHSINSFMDKSSPLYKYKFYIGVDKDDKLYSQFDEKKKIYDLCCQWNNVCIQFYPFKEDIPKGYVTLMWNFLYKKAIEEHHDFYWSCGDDMLYCDDGWLEDCITLLKSTHGLGTAGTYNGNGRIITQFLVTKTHYEIFGRLFHPKIKNWYCDDYMNELYHPHLLHVINDKRCLNVGGEPRYTIEHSAEYFYQNLVKEDKEILFEWMKTHGGIKKYLMNKGKKGKLGLIL
tara:strand:+ start:38 stop:802 length:765 start_codon:yes stop_codon:yes gene_type:complete